MALRFRPPGRIDASVGHRFDEDTLAGVARSVGEEGEVAEARFHFDMRYRTRNGRVSRVDLTVSLSVTMPSWPARDERPEAEREEWDRFRCALRHHEDGHISLFRRESHTTYEKLAAETDPGRLGPIVEEETRRIQGLSDAYDRRTDHGRSQDTPCGNTVIDVP